MKNTPSLIGKAVTLHADLLDIQGNPHKLAGRVVTILNKTGKKAYLADDGKGGTTLFHDGDFTLVPVDLGTQYIHTASITSQVPTVKTSELHESPFNPRKTYDPAGLAELAETIKAVGIMQPLLVRWVTLVVDGTTLQQLEIVFGHRRYRAAKLAGLVEVPVMIRNLTDAQSARLQAIENLQREDLNPIEEAQGYADYCRDCKVTKQQVADHIGVSRTTVYNQLKLLELAPEGQALVRSGLLGTELAIEVARLGKVEIQTSALQKIFYGADLATVTADSKAMSHSQGVKLIQGIKNPEAETEAAKKSKATTVGLAKTRGYHALRELIRQLRENGTATDDEGDDTNALEELADAISQKKAAA